MANRYWNQFRYSFNKEPFDLNFQVSIGASGAPTLNASNSKGMLSIVRNSAGNYTLNFQNNFWRFIGFQVSSQSSTGIPAAPDCGIVSTNVSSSSAPGMVIQFSSAGVATDPASGEVLYGVVRLENSSAP